jgi:hypothetical protein
MAISAITLAELSAGPHEVRRNDEQDTYDEHVERARRLDVVQRAESEFDPRFVPDLRLPAGRHLVVPRPQRRLDTGRAEIKIEECHERGWRIETFLNEAA